VARTPGTKGDNAPRRIIVRREEIIGGGHHGGSWKIAYADFVTAMMAFFLVMWLINATTEQQRRGIASFFNPLASDSKVPLDNVMPQPASPIGRAQKVVSGPNNPRSGSLMENGVQTRDPKTDIARFRFNAIAHTRSGTAEDNSLVAMTRREIGRRLSGDQETQLAERHFRVEGDDDEIRISIEDDDHQPMFVSGQASPNAHAIALLKAIAPVLSGMTGDLSIGGYTDRTPYHLATISNWTLSALRADAARAILVDSGFPDGRIRTVLGYADRMLADPKNPLAAINRRVVLVMTRKSAAFAPLSPATDGKKEK